MHMPDLASQLWNACTDVTGFCTAAVAFIYPCLASRGAKKQQGERDYAAVLKQLMVLDYLHTSSQEQYTGPAKVVGWKGISRLVCFEVHSNRCLTLTDYIFNLQMGTILTYFCPS